MFNWRTVAVTDMRLCLCVHVAEHHTRLCSVALYGHGLCVRAAEREDAQADSELVTVPQWAPVGGRSACVHICMYACAYVRRLALRVPPGSCRRLSDPNRSPNKCVCAWWVRVLAGSVRGEPPPPPRLRASPNHLHPLRSPSPRIPAAPSAPECRTPSWGPVQHPLSALGFGRRTLKARVPRPPPPLRAPSRPHLCLGAPSPDWAPVASLG